MEALPCPNSRATRSPGFPMPRPFGEDEPGPDAGALRVPLEAGMGERTVALKGNFLMRWVVFPLS